MTRFLSPIATGLSTLSLLVLVGLLVWGAPALKQSLEKQSKTLGELAEHIYEATPESRAASLDQLTKIASTCPDWLLPANPEWLSQDQAAMLLASCSGSKAKERQKELLEMRARRVKALLEQERLLSAPSASTPGKAES